jgi:two-component system chemotaxis response regulator CheV
VLDLPSIVGCKPTTGLNIMLVTEYARTTQAFAVESVEDIVRLDWNPGDFGRVERRGPQPS